MSRYEDQKTLSLNWFNRANDLRGAAGAVWFAMENESESDQIHKMLGIGSGYKFGVACFHVFLMLCGLSLELIYKAVIIEKGKEPPAIHNLRSLSAQANIKMKADDLKLLDILSDHISWAGKYPIPKGGSSEWEQHGNRMHVALTERVPGMKFKVLQRNEKLEWDDYSRLWEVGHNAYWELPGQKYP